jgi:hypothetical protein
MCLGYKLTKIKEINNINSRNVSEGLNTFVVESCSDIFVKHSLHEYHASNGSFLYEGKKT